MSTQTKASAAQAQKVPHTTYELRIPPERPKQFRNKQLKDHDWDEMFNRVSNCFDPARQGFPDDQSPTVLTRLLASVSECYFEQIPWAQVLHYIVYNIPDRPELRLYEAIIQSRTLYLLLND